MARGGRRIGAGRKPNRLQVVTGSFDSRSAEGAETVIPVPPAGLSGEAAAVWREFAPLAVERQTLNRSTMLAFAMLCRNIVLEQALAADPSLVGGANHRGMLQRVETELRGFDLSPNGKPHGAVGGQAKPKSALEKLKERRASLKVV